MIETFITQLKNIQSPTQLFIICGLFIFVDILTGYLKALKFKKMNSSVSRAGYIKKMGWVLALILGFVVDLFVGTEIFLYGTAIVIIATEGISIYENFGEIGVNLPFAKYFEKLKDTSKEE